jgi:hypothetical protein
MTIEMDILKREDGVMRMNIINDKHDVKNLIGDGI